MSQLAERTAVVTGGGSGIGRGIVLALAGAGTDVAIAEINLEAAAKEVVGAGRRAPVVRIDVSDPASVAEGVRSCIEQLGHVDILVDNAGVVQSSVGLAANEADFNRCFEVNLRGDASRDTVSQRAAFDAHLKAACPLQREQTPEDIGNAFVFLASEAARNMRGQALNVDGGISMN
jgi:NAD(P)-dependent dehydrogenase (short-subunit alcohol dehydrogenase family)